jgi:ADP-ribose pyrophosphatase YjhB (NUDIX family)
MILRENQRVNVVVRALIVEDGRLLVTQWRHRDVCFAIGGRVEFGEPLIRSLQCEVQEETGAAITDYRLVYLAENIFTSSANVAYHEYGWYFRVELDRRACGLDEIIPNPDHPDLIIRYIALDEEHLAPFWPRFIRRYLPADWSARFIQNPRYIYNRETSTGEVEIQELEGLFE